MKDFRGREIKVGDKIAHTNRPYSYMYVDEAEVLEVFEDRIIVTKNFAGGNKHSTIKTSRYVAILDR